MHRVRYGLILIPAWISNYIRYKAWDEITYPFPNFNGKTHFSGRVINFHAGINVNPGMLVKGAPALSESMRFIYPHSSALLHWH